MADRVDHTHGDTGAKPPQDLNFEDGGFPNPQQFDWFWSEVPAAINNHADRLEAIDSDGDGTVDAADFAADADASTYKGADIDSDGDGVVDAADAVADPIPNSDLQNDAVTIDTQDGLTGGGTVALGESVTIGEDLGQASIRIVDSGTGVSIAADDLLFTKPSFNADEAISVAIHPRENTPEQGIIMGGENSFSSSASLNFTSGDINTSVAYFASSNVKTEAQIEIINSSSSEITVDYAVMAVQT